MARRQIRIGDMRTRVIICRQDSTGSANEDGQIPEDEEQWCERWAQVEPLRGRERFMAAQTAADVDYRVTVHYDRWTKQITPEYWIVEKDTANRLIVVRAYDPDGRRQFIEMECRQRVA